MKRPDESLYEYKRRMASTPSDPLGSAKAKPLPREHVDQLQASNSEREAFESRGLPSEARLTPSKTWSEWQQLRRTDPRKFYTAAMQRALLRDSDLGGEGYFQT